MSPEMVPDSFIYSSLTLLIKQRAAATVTAAARRVFGQHRLLKNRRPPFESLRANGSVLELIGHFPFVLSPSKHS
jgi:hypothetical protein